MEMDVRNFLEVGEDNKGDYTIKFQWDVLSNEKDAYAIVGILENLKLMILDTLDESRYITIDGDDDEDEDEDEEDDLF